MRPSQPLRLVARDRARRHPFGRPDYTSVRTNVWADPEPPVADTVTAAPKRDRTTRVFLIAMIAAVAVNFGAVLGSMGWSVLQGLGWVAPPAIEAMQREQGTTLSQLDATVHALNASVAGLNLRVDVAAERDEAADRRVADVESGLGSVKTAMTDVRAAQAAAEDSWRKPLAELTAAVTRTRGEVLGLRASLDEIGRQRQLDQAAISPRPDRMQHAMADRNPLGTIRGSIEAARPRPVTARDTTADGHIIQLAPVQ